MTRLVLRWRRHEVLLFAVEITHDSVDEFRLDIITLLVGLGGERSQIDEE